MTYIWYIIIYILVVNLITSFRLIIAVEYNRLQKLFQFFIIWCIPLFGVVIVSYFLNQIPIILSEKLSKYTLIIKIILYPLLIKVKSFESTFNNSNYADTHIDIGGGSD